MAQGDFVSAIFAGTASHETRQKLAKRRVEIESTLLVEQHRHGCCSNDLGHACEVEDGLGRYARRWLLVGKLAESVRGQDFAAGDDAKGATWKCVRCNGVFEDADGRREASWDASIFGWGLRGEIRRSWLLWIVTRIGTRGRRSDLF